MEYREAVAEARILVKRSEDDQWRLAELTWEQIQAGYGQQQWADDIGSTRRSVRRWAAVWDEYRGAAMANRPNWTDAQAEIDPHTRYSEPRARETFQRMLPEQKAEVVREALAEPEVADRIVRDTPTRARLAKAENTVDREMQETARERYELAEPRSVQIGAMADAEYGLTKIRTAAEDVSAAVDKLIAYGWPDNSKERVEILTQRAAAAVEMIKAKTEGRDLDQELQALLEGGEG